MSGVSWERQVTDILLIAVPLLAVAWDLVAELSQTQATISEVSILYFYRHPVLPMLIGALFGHLCWPVVRVRPHWETAIIVVVVMMLAVLVDRLHWLPAMMPVLPLVIGIPLGHILWPQRVATETGESLVVQSGPVQLNTRTVSAEIPVFRPKP